jgi:hypothetical protein
MAKYSTDYDNSNYDVYGVEQQFTLDILLSQPTTKTFTLSIVVKDQDYDGDDYSLTNYDTDAAEYTLTPTLDIIVVDHDKTLERTADILVRLGGLKTTTLDLLTKDTDATKTFTLGIELYGNPNYAYQDYSAKNWNTDAVETSQTFSADMILTGTRSVTPTVDIILKASLTKTTTLDILTRESRVKTTTLDIITVNQRTKSTTADILVKLDGSKTTTLDTILIQTNSKTSTADIITVNQATKSPTLDIITKATQTKTFSVDIFPLIVGSKTLTSDIFVINRGSKTPTIDIIVLLNNPVRRTVQIRKKKRSTVQIRKKLRNTVQIQ